MSGELVAEDLTKVFPGGGRALDGVSFSVKPGSVLVLLGPSGCGKSTLLRIIAGLETATSGSLTLDGSSLLDVPPGRRDVAMVFQSYALYPHLDVRKNLSLALEVRKVAPAEIDSRVKEAADMLGLEDLLGRKPGQLSGGQQQRVALGRALVRRPRLYLLDEPLSNLDATRREDTRTELKSLFRRLSATVVYVTHDQVEAMTLADEVAVLASGQLKQHAPPLELYRRPGDLFVAGFVGSPRINVVKGRREGDRFVPEGEDLATSPFRLSVPGGITAANLVAGMRPEDVEVLASADENRPEVMAVTVELHEPLGAQVLLTLRAGSVRLRALVPSAKASHVSAAVVPVDAVHWFDASTGRRL